MGISYEGGMLVGERLSKVKKPVMSEEYDDDVIEFAYDNDMVVYSEYYDADKHGMVVGFEIQNILVNNIDSKWLDDIRNKAKRFHDIFGVPAKLIGMQDIC